MSGISPVDDSTRAETIARGLTRAISRGSGAAQRFPTATGWRQLSYAELDARARAMARGLIDLGVGPGDRVALVSRTRAEWTQADLATMMAGATLVPVYETNSADEVRYVVEHSGARIAFCEDAEQVSKLTRNGRAGAVEHLISFEGEHAEAIGLEELVARGADGDDAEIDARTAAVGPDDLATLVYTSGTTGPPKGCRLSQHALWANSRMVDDHLRLRRGGTFFLFLPLAHVLTRMVQFVALQVDGELAYWSGSMDRIAEDLQEVRPTHLPLVPRVLEKGYARAHAAAAEGGRVKHTLFRAANAAGRRAAAHRRQGRPLPPALRVAHAAADKAVLAKVRDAFGGRVELSVCGGAPIDPAVLEFFDGCGIPVLEGYGMTETSAVTTFNPMQGRRFGSVGPPLPGSEIRIDDDGEVLARGPHIFDGYEGDPEGTRAALKDGWLCTGDIGALDPDGFLTLVGRKKEIVVTSSGKNVSPANIELALSGCPWISQAVVHGDRRPYLVALLTLDPEPALKRAEELGIDAGGPEELITDERMQAELAAAVTDVNSRFAPIAQVKRFSILPRELSQEEGELTPSLKIKRNVVQERHADDLDRLYGDRRGPADVWIERPRPAAHQDAAAAAPA